MKYLSSRIFNPVIGCIIFLASLSAHAIDVKFIKNELYSSDMCRQGFNLMVQIFEVKGADIKSLVWAGIVKNWPGYDFPAANVSLEKIVYRDAQNRVLRATCLHDKFNVDRSARFKFIDTTTGEPTGYIDAEEPRLEIQSGKPDLIKIGK